MRSARLARAAATMVAIVGALNCGKILGIDDARLSSSAADLDGATARNDDGGALGCTTNLAGDPHNCGVCGHDCLGGGCTAGACTPSLLVDAASLGVGRYFRGSIAVNGSDLVWTDSRPVGLSPTETNVHTCKLPGCATPALVTAAEPGYTLGLSGGVVFFDITVGERRSLFRCPVAACGSGTQFGATGSTSATLEGFDPAVHVLFFDLDDPAAHTTSLFSCAEPDCPSPMLLDVASTGFTLHGFAAVDDGDAYFLRGSDVRRCAFGECDGGNSVVVASNVNLPLASAKGRLGVTGLNAATIETCSLPGCADLLTLVTQSVAPASIVTDDHDVTWLQNDGSIARCPVTGCNEPELLYVPAVSLDPSTFPPEATPALVTDGVSLFWTTPTALYRLAL